MKIKHWQGYGTVNAKKISAKEENGIKTLMIEVTGNHEYGLVRNDIYDVYNWLVKRFDKTVPDYRHIRSLDIVESTVINNGVSTERATYTIQINT